MSDSELSNAIRAGDLEGVRSLLDGGADIRFVHDRGYTAANYVMSGPDATLFPILQLLIDRGADLNVVSDYGESAMSRASYRGRFDAVWMLLNAGADHTPLEWTALMFMAVLGTAEHVREEIGKGAVLADRDRWNRTAFLLSVEIGDIAKAELLVASGADIGERGLAGYTPLMYASQKGHAAMVDWLLEKGVEPDATDERGHTALIQAAGRGSVNCVRSLLNAGADAEFSEGVISVVGMATNLEIVRLLIRAGADFNDINDDIRRELIRLPSAKMIDCTPEEYGVAKHRIFGISNPQLMNHPFWKAMISSGRGAWAARNRFEPDAVNEAAIWCFDRFGKSITELPDGRIVEIGGEHEDRYDSDFCIYNDVIVHRGDGTFDIYGYPIEVFPPTDFHSATLIGGSIYIIGRLGYPDTRSIGSTPIYRLDIETWSIEPFETSGRPPGWIFEHRAKQVDHGIELYGGKSCHFDGEKQVVEANRNRYFLDVATATWSIMISCDSLN